MTSPLGIVDLDKYRTHGAPDAEASARRRSQARSTPAPQPGPTYPPSTVDAWAHRTVNRWTASKADHKAAQDYLGWRNRK